MKSDDFLPNLRVLGHVSFDSIRYFFGTPGDLGRVKEVPWRDGTCLNLRTRRTCFFFYLVKCAVIWLYIQLLSGWLLNEFEGDCLFSAYLSSTGPQRGTLYDDSLRYRGTVDMIASLSSASFGCRATEGSVSIQVGWNQLTVSVEICHEFCKISSSLRWVDLIQFNL